MAVARGGPQTLMMLDKIINEIPVGTCSTLRIRPVTGVTMYTYNAIMSQMLRGGVDIDKGTYKR